MRIIGSLKTLVGRITIGGVSTTLSASLIVAAVIYGTALTMKRDRLINVVGENLYHEVRGESIADQYKAGLITLARAADNDKQWPKSIIGVVAQDRAFSWVLDHKLATKRDEKKKWNTAIEVATNLIDKTGSTILMPKGWECVRYYKRTDNKGVSEKSRKWFEKALVPVGEFGKHTAYREKKGCVTPMRTTI